MNHTRTLLLIAALFWGISTPALAQYKIKSVVIDAGHGGKDPGAIGSFSKEKEITLAVSLKLGQMINERNKDIRVLQTRTTDIYPSLKDRHEIANKANADLFISIHVNSTAGRKETIRTGSHKVKRGRKYVTVPTYKTIFHRETSTAGTETYVLGLHRVGQKEEAIAEFGDNVSEEPGLLDMSDPTTNILIQQYSQRFLTRSVAFATKIQNQFNKQGRGDLGVKQKGLEVLAGSAMPGVLIEIGFINNPEEERYLNTPEGVAQVATAIYNALIEFGGDKT